MEEENLEESTPFEEFAEESLAENSESSFSYEEEPLPPEPVESDPSAGPFYTLVDGSPVRLRTPVNVNGVWTIFPTRAQAAALGAYELDDATPAAPEGKVAVPSSWFVDTEARVIRREWGFEDAPPPPPRTFSKLKIVAALRAAGAWEAAKAWLESHDYWDLFLAAQDFSEDYRAFVDGKDALADALGWSSEEVETLLENCVAED